MFSSPAYSQGYADPNVSPFQNNCWLSFDCTKKANTPISSEQLKSRLQSLLDAWDLIPEMPEIPGYLSYLKKALQQTISMQQSIQQSQNAIVNAQSPEEVESQVHRQACMYGIKSECGQ